MMVMAVKRRIRTVIALGMVCAVLVAAGVYRDEFVEVALNATVLCFSCIGIR